MKRTLFLDVVVTSKSAGIFFHGAALRIGQSGLPSRVSGGRPQDRCKQPDADCSATSQQTYDQDVGHREVRASSALRMSRRTNCDLEDMRQADLLSQREEP